MPLNDPISTIDGHRYDGLWAPGELAYFEYHGEQDVDAGNVDLWQRSQQAVVLLDIDASCDGMAAFNDGLTDVAERLEAGVPIFYRARFVDGAELIVSEDEVLIHPRYFADAYAPMPIEMTQGIARAA